MIGLMRAREIFRSQLGQNILTNYAATLWLGGLSILLIPVYLRLLGATQWGVVAICMVIQGVLTLLDAGLGQVMLRDVARSAQKTEDVALVFRVFARAYWVLGLVGFVLGQLAVPWLTETWFNQGQGVPEGADIALRLVLVQFLFQFANSAHGGYWNGVQAQKLANIRQCGFATAKHAGALALIVMWQADATAYLASFAIISMIECGVNAMTIRRALRDVPGVSLTRKHFSKLAKETSVLALGVLIGMSVSQIDRVVLSRLVSVEAYGHYAIVASLGLAFLQLQYPLMRAFFPRVVHEDAMGHSGSFRKLAAGILVLCVLPCLAVALAAPWVLALWLQDVQVVSAGVAPLRLILGAVAINAVYHLLYQRILARGRGRTIVLINSAALLVTVPATILATGAHGIVAGGIAWLVSASVQLTLGLVWLKRETKMRPLTAG
ncbi:MAG: oligosaccharide flippase family protein [Denitromonas halophila]|nr:MAG: oligosaccharide flippase family protein [Denitromonas halophila]TVT65261.1 MAG: oligosaccharide flippase family protein [Denitromonas halophila]